MNWQPNLASQELEQAMEAKDVPEADRDEVRRFSEFLGRVKGKREGKKLPPAPEGMKAWVLGENQ